MHYPAIIALVAGFLLAGCAQTSVERHFNSRKSQYRVLCGDIGEPSCGGSGMGVYLDGEKIQKIAYGIETSHELITRDYYFSAGNLRLVVEKHYSLLDEHAERRVFPKLKEEHRYNGPPDSKVGTVEWEKLQKHARYLIAYFHKHRSEFGDADEPESDKAFR